jgi:hypothetical protein
VECGRISQVSQTECFFGNIFYQNRDHANQLFVCLFVGLHQTGTIEIYSLIESFCTEIQNLFQGIKERLERT